MGLWSRIVGGKPAPEAKREEPRFNVAFQDAAWTDLSVLGRQTVSGESVNWQSALRVSTWLRCGLVIADDVSTVPCKVMKKDLATGKRTVATDHPLQELLDLAPNGWMDPLQLMETMAIHTFFTGAGRCFINRVRGRIYELVPLRPECVTVEQMPDYSLKYTATGANGLSMDIPQDAIWEVRGPSWDGWRGMDVVNLGREALGLSMATERAHAARFGNGIQTTGLYSVEGNLDDAQYQRLYSWLVQNQVGAKNSGKPFLLDRKAEYTQIDMNGVDSQHLETRRFQIEEVCRNAGVLPIMVGHSDKAATYASSEQMFLHHNVRTARPWHRRFEKAMKRQLLTREEVKQGYYIKFFETELLRGAAKDRGEYYWKMFQMGGLSPNKLLAMEDMDGYEGGDIHLVPANLITPENAAIAAAKPGVIDPATEEDQEGDDTGMDQLKAQFDAYGVGVRAGAITPQKSDEEHFRKLIGLPSASKDIDAVWSDEPTRRPITLVPPGGLTPGVPPAPSVDTPTEE